MPQLNSTSNYSLVYGIIAFVLLSCNNNNTSNIQGQSMLPPNKTTTPSPNFKKGILTIFQDSKSNYWIGSREEGVCKYDGKNYDYFTEKESLPSNQVRAIQEDEQGNIWLTTSEGICFYKENKWTTVSVKKSWEATSIPGQQAIPAPSQWHLKKGSLWFPVYNNGVLRYQDGLLEYLSIPIAATDTTIYNEQSDRPYHHSYASYVLHQDKTGKLWLGTFNRGVVGYDGQSFDYHNPNNFGVGTIRSIFQDKGGTTWFGGNGGGLYTYDGTGYVNFTEKHGLTSSHQGYDESGTLSRVWSINQDDEGNMWFGTADAGLWKFDGDALTNYTIEDGLPSNFVETIYKDQEGQLWFCSGMAGNGVLYTLYNGAFQSINTTVR